MELARTLAMDMRRAGVVLKLGRSPSERHGAGHDAWWGEESVAHSCKMRTTSLKMAFPHIPAIISPCVCENDGPNINICANELVNFRPTLASV